MMRFSYEERVDPGFVAVDMKWADGEREGEVRMPEAMRQVLLDNNYPLPEGVQRLDFAVSYGVCIAPFGPKATAANRGSHRLGSGLGFIIFSTAPLAVSRNAGIAHGDGPSC
jgi:hypothetical protein